MAIRRPPGTAQDFHPEKIIGVRTSGSASDYWESISEAPRRAIACRLWRRFCDSLHERLIKDWVGEKHFRSALKTDLFDEAMGKGLINSLASISDRVCGIDIAGDIVDRAQTKNPTLEASIGDVRQLDFPDDTFDFVFSNSTLDHFETVAEIRQSLRELARVLAPGGLLLITLDNPTNPVVALRNKLPQAPMGALGLIPYFMGRTLSMGHLRREVGAAGFAIHAHKHILHVPRVAALHLCRMLEYPEVFSRTALRGMLAFEAAANLPTAHLTGHFSALLARKET